MSKLSKMSRKRKFVYNVDDEEEKNKEDNDNASVEQRNSSSESSESDSEGDIEKDLLQFDDDQAELIRSVNKMGSARLSASEYSNIASPNHMSASGMMNPH